MKCLEIINDKIAELKDTYQHYTAVEKDKAKSSFAKFDIEQFQQIKQSLEVLEIINKKNVRIGEIKYYLKEFKEGISISVTKIEDVLIEYNKGVALEDELTLEELLKLKQWLEGNE